MPSSFKTGRRDVSVSAQFAVTSIPLYNLFGSFLLTSVIPAALADGKGTPRMIVVLDTDTKGPIDNFLKGIARHRHPERETDPPAV